jgi:3-oxoacyl-[acyl-carrier-protein] synthase III
MATALMESDVDVQPRCLPLLKPAFVSGLGAAVPTRRVGNDELAARFEDLTADGIETRTGIQQRYHAAEGQRTSELAVDASRAALERAGVRPDDLDLILLATATPDQLMPATACRVQDLLGARHASAMDVAAACSGFVYALCVGQQFIATGQARSVLVIGAEVMSRIVDPTDRQCAVLFGDGAGACVLTAAEGPCRLGRFWTKTYGEQYGLLTRNGGTDTSTTADALEARQAFMRMDGRRVFRAAVEGFSEAIRQTAEVNDLAPADFNWIVPHQANARIFAEVAARTHLPADRFWLNLQRYGNTGAASIPLALAELEQTVGATPGERLALVAVGAGLTVGGVALFAE